MRQKVIFRNKILSNTTTLISIITLFATSSTYAFSLDKDKTAAQTYLYQNLSRVDAKVGSVVASPSKSNPNYYYHWVRDGALVMMQLVQQHEMPTAANERSQSDRQIQQYIDWVSYVQQQPTPSQSLAEPKFEVDGTAFQGEWARPQSDGPALRAMTLMRYAHYLLAHGDPNHLLPKLYLAAMPAESIIKRDLEYVAHHWQEPSYDLWEEVSGQHFYNYMVQREALKEGAVFAQIMKDQGAAAYYQQQAQAINNALDAFWDADKAIIQATLHRNNGIDYKDSGLDIAIILAVLHAHPSLQDSYNLQDPRVLNTIVELVHAFQALYPLNQQEPNGIALGRYPEDRYDGTGVSQGNPWFLASNALGEFFLKHLQTLSLFDKLVINQDNLAFYQMIFKLNHESVPSWLEKPLVISTASPEYSTLKQNMLLAAQNQLNLTERHASTDFHLSEQFNRTTGFQQGAPDLTWSYASVLSFIKAHEVLD